MKAEDSYSSALLLPEGCYWKNNDDPYRNTLSSGIFTIATNSTDGNLQKDIASLSFEKGVLSGKAVFYNENNQEEYIYNNNKKEGWGVVLFNSTEITKLYYENGQLLRKLERSSIRDDYWKEIDVASGSLLGYFKLDNNNKRTGVGYCYSNGVIEGVFEFDNDEKGHCMKSMQESIMKEYVNGEEVYCGEFVNSFESDFARLDCSSSNSNDQVMKSESPSDTPVKYEGEMNCDIPGGQGVLYDKSGSVIYEGIWKDGLNIVDGGIWFAYSVERMIAFYGNGSKKYEGKMDNCVPNGYGIYYDENGSILYKGEWKNGLFEVEDGMWFDYSSEKFCGLYDDGSKKYEGDMSNGLPEGNGAYYDKNGVLLYIGLWKSGNYEIDSVTKFCYISDCLCFLYDDGTMKYKGGTNNRLPEGFGVYYDRNGNEMYEGKWSKGLLEISKGMLFDYVSENMLVYYDDNSLKFIGKMKNRLPDGNGIYFCNDGLTKFEGIWKNGFLEVEGRIDFNYRNEYLSAYYVNGSKKYEGKMDNCVPNGYGIYYDENGSMVYKGEWKNGLFEVEDGMWFDYSSEKFCGLYDDGSKKYEGDMSNGLPDGKGIYYDKKGKELYNGYWIDGEIHVKDSKWFCYVSGKVEMRRMRSFVEKFKLKAVEMLEWLKKKSIMLLIICLICIIALLFIIGFLNGFFFRMGNGFDLIGGILTITGGNHIYGNFKISGYNKVKSIIIKEGSLANVKSFKINNCNMLESLVFEYHSMKKTTLQNVHFVELRSRDILC